MHFMCVFDVLTQIYLRKESMGEVDHGRKIVDDLRVEIKDVCYVHPSEQPPAEGRSMFMSNIDQVLNFDVQTVNFFAANRDFPPRLVTETLKEALGKVLVPYSFLAGRLSTDGETGRLEFDCNGKGVGFVAAESAFSVDEIGDLSYPNRAFGQLVSQTVHNLLDRTAAPCNPLSDDDEYDHPLAIFQVTKFRCGGFAIGLSINHTAFDGMSRRLFLDNLAAVAGGKPLPVPPCNDRRLLAARSPPRVTYPHPELRQLDNNNLVSATTQVFETTDEDLDFKIFPLTSSHVSLLKHKARNPHATSPSPVSGFYAVAALIWRCKALSYSPSAGGGEEDRVSTILYAVNIRHKLLTPSLAASYTGNAVLTAYATAKCSEISEAPLWRMAEMLAEGGKRITSEYVRSVIDWGEVYGRGFPCGEILVSSWWRLGFAEVDYPWGKPIYSCPVVHHRKDIVLVFPDIVDEDGVNVIIALPLPQMRKFGSLFDAILSSLDNS